MQQEAFGARSVIHRSNFCKLSNFQLILFSNSSDSAPVQDSPYIVTGAVYDWCNTWTLARGKDCLYMWSTTTAIELSNGSNGWFRYILDGKLSTMYSSGSPEGGSDSSGGLVVNEFDGDVRSLANTMLFMCMHFTRQKCCLIFVTFHKYIALIFV